MQIFNIFTIFALATAAAAGTAAYTGPCSKSACGSNGAQCAGSLLCVPYPSFDPALREGCVCAQGSKKRESFAQRRQESAAPLDN